MKHLIFALLVCSTSISTLPAQNANQNSKNPDQKFVTEAIEAGLAEVELGKLGQDQGNSPEIKEYGRMMEQDHSKANDELRALAKQFNMTLPTTFTSAMRKKHTDLKERSGQDFDQVFMKQMIEDHRKAIALFENEAKNGQNEQIRTWAKKMLPTLKQHLQHALHIYDNFQN